MQMQLAVFCLFAVSLTLANTYSDRCSLRPCGQRLGVYYLTLSRPARNSSYQVVTFHSDGILTGIASNQGSSFSSFEGVWECQGRDTVEATDFLFNFASGSSPATLSKGEFRLKLSANDQVSGTLNATIYDLASTTNPNQSTWVQITQLFFNVNGYKALNRCAN